MDRKRIVLGGLLAGLVFFVVEAAAEPLLGPQMEWLFSRLGLPMPGEEAMVAIVAAMFVLGILTVWLYAALEVCYGSSSGTVLRTAATVWALSCLVPTVAFYAYGIMVGPLVWITTISSLVQSTLATFAGSWVYRRGPSRTPDLASARV